MSHNNGIISKPISFLDDIAVVLGRSTGDLTQLYRDMDEQGQFISPMAVNMWSLKKPVPWSTNQQKVYYPQASATWYLGKDGDFGIKSRTLQSYTYLENWIDGALNGWTYNRDEFVDRALDFDGYYHNARNPFDYLYLEADRTEVTPGGVLTIQYQMRTTHFNALTEIDITDLYCYEYGSTTKHAISDMYLAIIVYQKSGNTYNYYEWISTSATLSDLMSDPAMHSLQYTVPSTEGNYRFIPVLTNIKKTTSSQAIANVTTIPGTNFTDFVVANTVGPYMRVDAYVLNSGTSSNPNYNNTVYYYVNFYGGTSLGGQFSNINIDFYDPISGSSFLIIQNVQMAGNSPVSGTIVFPAGTLTVNANASKRIPTSSRNTAPWPSSSMTLESFVRDRGGMVRIHCNTSGSTMPAYEQPIREAAGDIN